VKRETPAALAAVMLALAVPVAAPRPAEACSLCEAGDPIFSATGTTVQQKGDFRVFLQGSGWRKKSGALPHGEEGGHAEETGHEEGGHGDAVEENVGRKLELFASWTPLERLTLTLDLPFLFTEITEIEGPEQETFHLDGFGDVSLLGSFVLWRNRDVLPNTWFEGRAFLKFPTGESSKRVNGVKDPHLQPGTGSWDFGFGLAAVHKLRWGSLFSSIAYRVNTEGSLDYEYGDVLLVNSAMLVPLGHTFGIGALEPYTLGLELNYRWAQKDVFRGAKYRHSGGSLLYSTPSLRIAIPGMAERIGAAIHLSAQIPLGDQWLNGFQEEHTVWRGGLALRF
jgi:hypothetical protein